jgi:hypothetical protein
MHPERKERTDRPFDFEPKKADSSTWTWSKMVAHEQREAQLKWKKESLRR